jgi:hypothetical protein
VEAVGAAMAACTFANKRVSPDNGGFLTDPPSVDMTSTQKYPKALVALGVLVECFSANGANPIYPYNHT